MSEACFEAKRASSPSRLEAGRDPHTTGLSLFLSGRPLAVGVPNTHEDRLEAGYRPPREQL